MADYSSSGYNSAINNRSNSPQDAIDGQEISRLEPVLGPDELKRKFLFGIPLMSKIIDPITRKAKVMDNDDLKEFILDAISEFEMETGISIVPVQREERHPFDRNHLNSWGYLQLDYSPIISVDALKLASGQTDDVYQFPNEWIDLSYAGSGLLYFTPLLAASPIGLSGSVLNTSGGAIFLQFCMGLRFQPTLFKIIYTSGFKDGLVPRVINGILGCIAGMNILSLLASTNVSNSSSLSLDGMSQSVSTPGTNLYDNRIAYLADKKKGLLNKIKKLYKRQMIMTTF